jgi:hypothetical protein
MNCKSYLYIGIFAHILGLLYFYFSGNKNFTEKLRIYVKLLIAMYLQLEFELILIYNKATMNN